MKAMLLAAGRGERMRPLTDTTPKPLLEVKGKALIVRLIEQLVTAGFEELVINTAWLGSVLQQRLGDGGRFGAHIRFTQEPAGALGTAGGIQQALPLLGEAPFLLVNGDVYTDFPFARLLNQPQRHAHLVLVDNPEHHPRGDFSLDDGRVRNSGPGMLTYSGIAALSPALFAGLQPGKSELGPLLRQAADAAQVSGERYSGCWADVGTPERLQQADQAPGEAGRA